MKNFMQKRGRSGTADILGGTRHQEWGEQRSPLSLCLASSEIERGDTLLTVLKGDRDETYIYDFGIRKNTPDTA